MIIVLTTVPDQAAGEALAESIVEARLAGCVQVLPRMTSVYMWEGQLIKDSEHLLLIKTLPKKYDELERFINQNHGYDTPEIIAIETEGVSDHYLKWLTSMVND